MIAQLAPDGHQDHGDRPPEDTARWALRRLGPLVHELSNQLQYAVGMADLLAEDARTGNLPLDVRRDIADLLDRLDAVVGTVRQAQTALRDGAVAASPPPGGQAGR